MPTLTYHTLRDEGKLPPGTRFVDPYDHTPFLVNKGETFTQLITRIAQSREEKGYSAIEPETLKQLVTDSLFESSSNKIKQQYFQEQQANPTQSQIFSFIRATASTLVNAVTISPKQRQTRASHCLSGCRFHSKGSTWGQTLGKVVSKIVGIHDATTSEEEKAVGICTMCGGCALKTKVGYSLNSVLVALTPEQLDRMLAVYGNKAFEVCWIFKEAISDPQANHLLTLKLGKLNTNNPRTIAAIQILQKIKIKKPSDISLR